MATQKKQRSSTFWIVLVVALVLGVPCAVAAIGGLAAIAIPSFVGYTQRSKTAEARSHLSNLFQGAAAYYVEERRAGLGAYVSACTVSSATTPNEPGAQTTVLEAPPESFDALGVSFSDPVRYQYEIESAGGCDHPPNTPLYTFRARGDLDGDGAESLYELTVSSDGNGELVRAPEIHVENELE